jgi:hypothetical protein
LFWRKFWIYCEKVAFEAKPVGHSSSKQSSVKILPSCFYYEVQLSRSALPKYKVFPKSNCPIKYRQYGVHAQVHISSPVYRCVDLVF